MTTCALDSFKRHGCISVLFECQELRTSQFLYSGTLLLSICLVSIEVVDSEQFNTLRVTKLEVQFLSSITVFIVVALILIFVGLNYND